jgi:hypothetical protein
MEKATIHQIISDRNKDLERNALRTAEDIIKRIAAHQEVIEERQTDIAALRKELKELEIQQMNAKDILGEE